MTDDEARSLFADLREAGGKVAPDQLDEVWAALPTVRIDEILGTWRGSEFDTGHRMNGTLEKAGWFGTTFTSASDVQPLVRRRPGGEPYSDVELGGGEASLWMVEFRGEVTATMVYDGRPVFDHFKRVDDGTLMGIMNGKQVLDHGRHYYFILERA